VDNKREIIIDPFASFLEMDCLSALFLDVSVVRVCVYVYPSQRC